jgi:hypothetical protein
LPAGFTRRGKQAQEQLDRRVRLRDFDAQIRGVQAQESRQIRRRGVRRIELNHRGRDEQDAHETCSVSQRTAGLH